MPKKKISNSYRAILRKIGIKAGKIVNFKAKL